MLQENNKTFQEYLAESCLVFYDNIYNEPCSLHTIQAAYCRSYYVTMVTHYTLLLRLVLFGDLN